RRALFQSRRPKFDFLRKPPVSSQNTSRLLCPSASMRARCPRSASSPGADNGTRLAPCLVLGVLTASLPCVSARDLEIDRAALSQSTSPLPRAHSSPCRAPESSATTYRAHSRWPRVHSP